MEPVPPLQSDPVIEVRLRARATIDLQSVEEGLSVQYARTGWQSVGEGGGDGIKCRETTAKIAVAGAHAGSVLIVEYRVPWWMEGDDLLREMDEFSQATFNLAEAIVAGWEEPGDIFPYGELVELRRAWMKRPWSNGGRLRAAVSAILDLPHKQRALLILKAFPLEFEGAVTSANRSRFEKRRQAMMRHYRHLFGVEALPGKNGREGWMYAIPSGLIGLVPRPARRRRERR